MFVKVCCISSHEEAKMAIDAGADAIGLVGAMPSGPGIIDDELIAEIASVVRQVETFLLTSETTAEGIISHHQRTKTSAIQIVDKPEPGVHEVLRSELPGVKVVQVVHVSGEDSVKESVSLSEMVDVILLDSGNPNLAVKELGGTGRTHDWSLSKKIVEQSRVPVILAGGLNPQNVSGAIRAVGPIGVDLCSGVRINGELDSKKLSQFFKNVRSTQHDSV